MKEIRADKVKVGNIIFVEATNYNRIGKIKQIKKNEKGYKILLFAYWKDYDIHFRENLDRKKDGDWQTYWGSRDGIKVGEQDSFSLYLIKKEDLIALKI